MSEWLPPRQGVHVFSARVFGHLSLSLIPMPKVGTTAATLRIAPFPRELGTAIRRDAIPEALFAIVSTCIVV